METTTATADPRRSSHELPTAEDRRVATINLLRAALDEDWDTVLATYSPDIVWMNPVTAGPWAGRFEGIEAVATMFAEYTAFFEGSFAPEVIDVCASPERSVALVVERGVKAGHVYENRAMWTSLFDDDGRIIEVVTVDRDLESAKAFWDSVST